ncbi:MAG: amino acid transporter [Desulfobulbaceae bacterium BRH_c16a]|nr:MAG: amino acid transporter [Desulfobulbaceae bacterium BRH_c16a]
MNIFLQGMGVGAGLIIAIGAQNTFVLTQGIRRQHHWLIAAICSCSDMLLIFIGAAGLGSIIAGNPTFRTGAAWAGAVFLFWLGVKAFKGAWAGKQLCERKEVAVGLRTAVLTTLALTFLNPHVYIDTILLIGSIGGQYQSIERLAFALGASVSSVLWFFTLSLGGSLLAPLFQKSIAWRILDLVVCMTMWTIAWQLVP